MLLSQRGFIPSWHNSSCRPFRDFNEYEWSKQYLRLLVDSFPAGLAPRVWKRQDIILLQRRFHSPRFLCFHGATLMDRMAYNKDGGIFAGFFSADWMRALSYKYALVLAAAPAQPAPHLSIVERFATRRWRKLPLYIHAIERRFAGVRVARPTHS